MVVIMAVLALVVDASATLLVSLFVLVLMLAVYNVVRHKVMHYS